MRIHPVVKAAVEEIRPDIETVTKKYIATASAFCQLTPELIETVCVQAVESSIGELAERAAQSTYQQGLIKGINCGREFGRFDQDRFHWLVWVLVIVACLALIWWQIGGLAR